MSPPPAVPNLSNASTPRPFDRLPLEVFLRVCAQADWRTMVRASHVSKGWRAAILQDRKLWSMLDGFNLHEESQLERIEVWAERAQGGLVGFQAVSKRADQGGPDEDSMRQASWVYVQALRRLSEVVGPANLRHLILDLDRPGNVDLWHYAYQLIGHLGHFAQLAATNLDSLELWSDLPGLPGGCAWLTIAPKAKRLLVTCLPDGDWNRLPDFLEFRRTGELEAVELEGWVMAGCDIADGIFPFMPRLSSLKLYSCSVDYLLELLTACSATLAQLWLIDVGGMSPVRQPPHDADPIYPRPLELPSLVEVVLADDSPLLWRAPAEDMAHLQIVAPALRSLSFGGSRDLWTWPDESRVAYHSSTQPVDFDLLVAIFGASPELRTLDVAGTVLAAEQLQAALAAAKPSSLVDLRLGQVASDDLLASLPIHLPRLHRLDIGRDKLTIIGMARMTRARLERPVGEDRLVSLDNNLTETFGAPGMAQPDADSLPSRDLFALIEGLVTTAARLDGGEVAGLLDEVEWPDGVGSGGLGLREVAREVLGRTGEVVFTDGGLKKSVVGKVKKVVRKLLGTWVGAMVGEGWEKW